MRKPRPRKHKKLYQGHRVVGGKAGLETCLLTSLVEYSTTLSLKKILPKQWHLEHDKH